MNSKLFILFKSIDGSTIRINNSSIAQRLVVWFSISKVFLIKTLNHSTKGTLWLCELLVNSSISLGNSRNNSIQRRSGCQRDYWFVFNIPHSFLLFKLLKDYLSNCKW